MAFGQETNGSLGQDQGMNLTLPGPDVRLDLYQFAGNMAWLKRSDRRNWSRYSLNSSGSHGDLKRYWDADGVYLNRIIFSGQKHLESSDVFYGQMQYNINYFQRVNRSIEPEPYALDPFVYTDSTPGDFLYRGPQVFVAYSRKIAPDFYLGASIDYRIDRGLKDVFTRPEIIHRSIGASFDLAYCLSDQINIGLSLRPYDVRDITKLVEQPNGQVPFVFRYRGEFRYISLISKADRTAKYRGWEIRPSFSYKDKRNEGVLFGGYYYRWQEVFDGGAIRVRNGYYQAQHYFLNGTWRFFPDSRRRNLLALGYYFRYIEDWAKEPVAGFMIDQDFYTLHQIRIGYARNLSILPLKLATEIHYGYFNPRRNDYLAHRYRKGIIRNTEYNMGLDWQAGRAIQLRGAIAYQIYKEAPVWNYFHDYKGLSVSLASAYTWNHFRLDILTRWGAKNTIQSTQSVRSRSDLNILLQLVHFY